MMNKINVKLRFTLFLSFLFFVNPVAGQYEDFHTVKAEIDFSYILRDWDGFGVNYVQTAHTRNYDEFPQEYGGFSILDKNAKEEIIDLIFGEDGLKPAMVKMFLDPLHQKEENGPYDHKTSTKYMLEFFDMGYKKTGSRGDDLPIITTLYSPPAYTTLQKELRGRDMDPVQKKNIGLYMADWLKFLQDSGYPVRYLSFHNEGEDWRRWAVEGDYANFDHGHDYNLYWRPVEVADFLTFMPDIMKEKGITGIGLTPGECSRFFQFYYSGYAKAIIDNEKALNNLALITSHNFYRVLPPGHRWFAGTSNIGTDMIRNKKPGIKAWVTSASWGNMDTEFIWQIWMNIYLAKINGYIPWACIQRPAHWVNKDPNPGTAIVVHEDGTYKIQRGYYLYKQVSQAGQPGMGVAYTESMDSEIQLIAFSRNNTENPDAFIIIHLNNNVPGRTDAVDLNINGKYYIFSNQDPKFNQYREDRNSDKYKNVRSASIKTDKGYNLEVSIPIDEINIDPEKENQIPLYLGIREGAYSLAGKLVWEDDVRLSSTPGSGNESHYLRKTDAEPDIDGKSDGIWDTINPVSIIKNDHPNTDPDLKASWKACFDDKNVYFFIDITDKTNLQGRKISLQIKGSEYEKFKTIRSIDGDETYNDLGIHELKNGFLEYEVPPRSVTSFYGIK